MLKKCTKCVQVLEITNFSSRKTGKDGYYNACKSCRLEYTRTDSYKMKQKERDKKNFEINKERKNKHRQDNKERYLELAKIHRRKSYLKHKARRNEDSANWKKKNMHICIEYVRTRKQKKKQGINNLTKEQKQELREIYKKCKKLNEDGKKFAVDHIIPLNNKNVCGLHAPWNLQILTIEENGHKHNKFDGTYNNDSWKFLILK